MPHFQARAEPKARNSHCRFAGTAGAVEHERLGGRARDVVLQLLELLHAAVEDLDGLLAGVQVLQDLRHDLALRRRVLLPHRAVHQLQDVLFKGEFFWLIKCFC